jgi:mannose-1-phosphate guanylyltransferase
LPIGGKSLLQIWLELLEKHEIYEVTVNLHWLHKNVKAFLKSFQYNSLCPKLSINLFYEPQLLGSAGTLLAKKDWISDDEPFLILYGDNLTNVNLTKMIAFHRRHSLPFTLGVFKAANPKECGIADVREDGVVTGFVEKPDKPSSEFAAAGVYVADRRIFKFFPDIPPDSPRAIDLGYHIIPRLIRNMKAYVIREFLMDIGTLESYKKAQELWYEVRS